MGVPVPKGLVEVHHRHLRVGVVGSLSEKCPRGQLVKSPTGHANARWCPATFPGWKRARVEGSYLLLRSNGTGLNLGKHTPTHTHYNQNKATMKRTNFSEQAEPTLLRATPSLGGVNTQQTQSAKGWGKGTKGKPGTLRNQWGEVWNSKGKGRLGKGHAWGDQWGKGRVPALAAAPAVVLGKGAFSWGGRGRGWGQRVQHVPYCSSPPGNPPRRERPYPLGNQGRMAKGGQPGTLSHQLGNGWNTKGQPGRGHCPRGDQRGRWKGWNKLALAAAPAVVLGKGTLPWGGRGRGWGREVPQVPFRSNPPGHSVPVTAPTQLGCKGGGAKGKGYTAKGGEQWQQWKGKGKVGGKARSGDHTIPVSNYWEVLQGRKPQAVCPGGQRLQGTDEEPFVPIRNSLESFGKGRNLAPSRVVSQSASWGG